jgi:hypothetical protein
MVVIKHQLSDENAQLLSEQLADCILCNWNADLRTLLVTLWRDKSIIKNAPSTATPVNFRQTSVIDAGNGDLRFTYAWDSSSGNLADLSTCGVAEIVTYPDTRNPWPFPPPFPANAPNPFTPPDVAGNLGKAHDDQFLTPSTTFRKPYVTADFSAKQYYRYRCSTSDGGNYVNLLGSLYITRLVSQNLNGS